MQMIKLENITKYYGKLRALNGISLDLDEEKVYGLLGPNGSGKSTLLKIILRLIEPNEGKVIFTSAELKNNFFNSIGYLPEERGLFKNSPVEEVITYFAKLKGLSGRKLEKQTNYWLERFSLAESRKKLIGQLSKGNQQKVQFITAIIHNPALLILDEPFTGFDPINQQLLKEVIREFSQKGKTVILSTHLMNFVEDICKEIIFLNEGNLLFAGGLEQIQKTYSEEKFVLEISKEKTTEEELKKIPYDKIKAKHPSLNEIFLRELKKRGVHEK